MGCRIRAGDSRLELGIVGHDSKAIKDFACESADVLGLYYNFMDCRGAEQCWRKSLGKPDL
jgi:hypothetical protein